MQVAAGHLLSLINDAADEQAGRRKRSFLAHDYNFIGRMTRYDIVSIIIERAVDAEHSMGV